MLEVLRDKKQLNCFRNFLISRKQLNSAAPLEFWMAIEDLKSCLHNNKKYKSKLNKFREKFLSIPNAEKSTEVDLKGWGRGYNISCYVIIIQI